MWKCTNCETLNQGKTCIVCGANEPKQNNQFQQENIPDYNQSRSLASCEISETDTRKEIEKIKQNSIILIAVVIILCVIACFVCGFYYTNIIKGKTDETEPKNVVVSTEDNAVSNDESLQQESEEIKEDEKAVNVDLKEPITDVENKVKKIKEWYYSTQENLDYMSKVENGSELTEYYDDNYELVRVDVAASVDNSYTRYYYFKDRNLYFAFIFDGTRENRLYFYEGQLFRWIDENGIIHDNELHNDDFATWERFVLEELENVY